MLVVVINIRVKPGMLEAFQAASVENARNSLGEPGIARFDILQNEADPTRFLFIEVYRVPEARAAHRATAHYAAWRDAVADMMAEPRTGVEFQNVFPGDEGW